MQVLTMDANGFPQGWLLVEDAAVAHTRGVLSFFGEDLVTLHGGICAKTGERTELTLKSMGVFHTHGNKMSYHHPVLTPKALFARDRHHCAYCGNRFLASQLEMEHIRPESRGGEWSWMNLVSACRRCNQRKGAKTPEEANMPLLFAPYVPNVYEHLILTGRNILYDQMEFLTSKVSRNFRGV